MTCPSCGHQNRRDARFCGECGTPLVETVACPSCGTSNPRGQRFCDSCGGALAAGDGGAPGRDPRSYTPDHLAEKIRRAKASLKGERKHVTVLFADVKGSMELAQEIDAERWHRIMDRFFAILSEGVHRFEGTVNKFTGDGIMALFGAPIAHEDHARRACYAALHLTEELARYADELRRAEGLNFSVRMGLNSGEVVVGRIGDDLNVDYTAIGHTVGLAQRMEQLAEPGTAYLTQHTAALVSGYMGLRDLGEFELKGSRDALRVYALEGVGSMRTRLDVARQRGLSRFVGRGDEMAVLQEALAQATAGDGQVVGVVGEAGVGKSRLCYEFAERCRAEGMPVYQGQAVAHGREIPFLPVLEMMRGYFGIAERDDDQAAREKIAGRTLLLDESLGDRLPLLFDFLGVPDPDRPSPTMDADARQRQLFAVVRDLLHARSRRRPALILVEDLHWIDRGSEAFLANLIDALPGTRTLLLATYRPEYDASCVNRPYARMVRLVPLGPDASEELLRDLLGDDPSLAGLAEHIEARTAGNPFFIEEVVQALVEGGSLSGEKGAYRLMRAVGEVAIPDTVQAVLAARIDRLPEGVKAVLQTAAVIGKELSEPVLRRVTELSEGDLSTALDELVASEFLYREALYPEAEYAFKHPLTQEVAYGSQLAERRRSVHGAVARAIADAYPDKVDERAALLAHHAEQAGDVLEAARWSTRAAEWAGPIHPAEAMRHARKVRELLGPAPETAEAIGLATAARTRILLFGWRVGIPEDEEAAIFAEGRALAERSGHPAAIALISNAYGVARGLAGDVEAALRYTAEAVQLVEAVADPDTRVALETRTYWLYLAGDLREALRLSDRIIELTKDDVRLGASVTGFIPHVWSLMIKGSALLPFMGRVEEARLILDRAVALADDYGDLETLGWAHGGYAMIASMTGEPEGAVEHASRGIEIAERLGSAFSRSVAYMQLARAQAACRDWSDSIAAAERAHEIVRETRAGRSLESLILTQLAEAHLEQGDPTLAREGAEESLALARERRMRMSECHALLALGRTLIAANGAEAADSARAALAEALRLVGETGATSFEPFIRARLAELARLTGDDAGYERGVEEARRLFVAIGAPKRAEELAAAV